MFLLVNKFKMIRNAIESCTRSVQKSLEGKHISKESNGFHNHYTYETKYFK